MGTCAAAGLVLPRFPAIPSSYLHVNLKRRLQLLIPSSFLSSSSSLSLVGGGGGALTFSKGHHSSPCRLFYCSSSSPLQTCPSSSSVDVKEGHQDEVEEGEDDDDDEVGTSKNTYPNLKKEEEEDDDSKEEVAVLPRFETPKLSVKEKKELASFAHSLGKKLKSQQVGKSGVTPSVAAAFLENLESNELLKVYGSTSFFFPYPLKLHLAISHVNSFKQIDNWRFPGHGEKKNLTKKENNKIVIVDCSN